MSSAAAGSTTADRGRRARATEGPATLVALTTTRSRRRPSCGLPYTPRFPFPTHIYMHQQRVYRHAEAGGELPCAFGRLPQSRSHRPATTR